MNPVIPSGRPESLPAWAGPLVVAAAAVAMLFWSWGKWPDVLVDYGQQLYAAWRIAESEVLYRDFAYFHGPLSSYVHGGLMRLFGVGLRTLVGFNILVTAALIALLYRLLLRIGDRLSATVGSLVFVTIFGFSQYLLNGNYNYVCPYTHEITHGLLLALAAIELLSSRWARHGGLAVAGSGLLLGLVFLTKAEVFVAAVVALAAGMVALAVTGRWDVRRAVRACGAFLGAALVAPAIAFGLFCLAMPAGDAASAVTAAYRSVLGEGVADLAFYRGWMGLSDPAANLVRMLSWAGWHAAIFVPVAAIALLWRAERWKRVAPPALAVCCIALMLPFVARVPWLEAARPLPLWTALAGVGWAIAILRRRRQGDPLDSAPVCAAALTAFALVLLSKMILFTRVFHYGFALAMPAALLFVSVLLYRIPRWIDRRGGRGSLFAAAALAVLAVAAVGHLRITAQRFDQKNVVVGSGADVFLADARGNYVNAALQNIEQVVAPGQTLVVVPDGITINYLARRASPVPFLNFVPTEIVYFGEQTILDAFRADPPDFVVIVDKDTSEFGYRYFGRDYARTLHGWIAENYRAIGGVGRRPLTGEGFGILLAERSDAAPRTAPQP